MSELEEQIRAQMRTAMHDLLCETMAKPVLTADDVEWIERLCHELKRRLKALTPRRADLHDELDASFDVELLGQQLRHGAAEPAEVADLAASVLDRLAALCAPAQDAAVAALRARLTTSGGAPLGRTVGTLIWESHRLLDEIERLRRPFAALAPAPKK